MIMYSRIVFLSVEIDSAAACVYCGVPANRYVFSHCVSLLTSWKLTPPPPAFIAEFLGVSLSSHPSLLALYILRLCLCISRKPCESLCILT